MKSFEVSVLLVGVEWSGGTEMTWIIKIHGKLPFPISHFFTTQTVTKAVDKEKKKKKK